MTGERYAASAEVADLHVSLSIGAKPASVIRNAIAEVMNLTWRQQAATHPGDAPVFEIVRSAADRARERALTAAEENAFRSQLRKLLQADADGDEALDRLAKSDDRVASTLDQPDGREGLDLLASLSPAQLEQAISDNGFRFGPGAPRPAADLGAGFLDTAKRNTALSRDPGFQITSATISRLDRGMDSYVGIDVCIRSDNGIGGHTVGIMIHPPADFRPWWDTDDKRNTRHQGDHEAEIRSTIESPTRDALIAKISESLGINYVAESYMQPRVVVTVNARRSLISEILGSATYEPQVWWRSGSVYMFQRKRWWEDRDGEIPDTLLDKIKARVKSGLRSLEDWSELAVLNEKQWGWLQSLREMGTEYEWLPELSLYQALSSGQRKLALGSGLSGSSADRKSLTAILAWLRKRSESGELNIDEVRDIVVRLQAGAHGTEFEGIAVMRDGSTAPKARRLVPLLPQSLLKRREVTSHHGA